MKFDITKLPVLEATIGFFLIVLAIGFIGAFAAVDSGDGDEGKPAASQTPSGTPAPDGSTLAVSMRDNSFDPDAYIIASGASVTFDITNDGGAIHNMRIAGADNAYDSDDDAVSDPDLLAGGDEAVLTWTSPSEAAEIDFRCDFHPVEMTGTLTVQ